MTDYNTPSEVSTTIAYMQEINGMLEDLSMLTEGYAWRSNTPVEIAQLHKCLKRVIKTSNKELTADYRDTMEKQVEETTDVDPAPAVTSNKVVDVEAPTSEEPVEAPTSEEPVEAPTSEEPVEAPTSEEPAWDIEAYMEYFEEYAHLNCDNYVMLLNELFEVGDNSNEHLTAIDDLIEQAWSLSCGDSLNENLGRFEDRLKAARAGETLTPAVQTTKAVVDVVSSDDIEPEADEELDMSIFDNYPWWSDEKHNGKPQAIFEYALNLDPTTCTLKEMLHGLLYSRVLRNTGKEGSLKVAELLDICSRRSFAGIVWPLNGKGDLVKTKAMKIIKPVIDVLKEDNDYTKKGLLDLTKTAYPTHAFYREDYLKDAVFKLDTPADNLDGDDLDSICDNIDIDNLTINVESQVPVIVPCVEVITEEVITEEVITNASRSALDIFNQ
jgi:hypothetical protein